MTGRMAVASRRPIDAIRQSLQSTATSRASGANIGSSASIAHILYTQQDALNLDVHRETSHAVILSDLSAPNCSIIRIRYDAI
jgi:antitoxin component HigA of HigAB toxin-antitoxin module